MRRRKERKKERKKERGEEDVRNRKGEFKFSEKEREKLEQK